MFSNAKRYDVKGKKYFEYPSKYYCTDIGLRNARAELNTSAQNEMQLDENVLAVFYSQVYYESDNVFKYYKFLPCPVVLIM